MDYVRLLFQINREMVNTTRYLFDSIRFRKYFSVWKVLRVLGPQNTTKLSLQHVSSNRCREPIKWRVGWMRVSDDWLLPTVAANSCKGSCVVYRGFIKISIWILAVQQKVEEKKPKNHISFRILVIQQKKRRKKTKGTYFVPNTCNPTIWIHKTEAEEEEKNQKKHISLFLFYF